MNRRLSLRPALLALLALTARSRAAWAAPPDGVAPAPFEDRLGATVAADEDRRAAQLRPSDPGRWTGEYGALSIADCTEQGCLFSLMQGNERSLCGDDGRFRFVDDDHAIAQSSSVENGSCRLRFSRVRASVTVRWEGEGCQDLCGHQGPWMLGGKFDPVAPQASVGCKRSEILQLFAAWLDAQRSGQLAPYFDQYDPDAFIGVKRTRSGRATLFGFSDWKRDRSAMFAARPELAADDLVVRTSVEDRTLGPDVVELGFTQRYRSKRYADHGPKLVRYWCGNEEGRPRIVHEEMLASEPGFDGPDKPEPPRVVDATRLVSPIALTWTFERLPLSATPPWLVSLLLTDSKGDVMTVGVGSTRVARGGEATTCPAGLPVDPIASAAFSESDYTDWFYVVPGAGGLTVFEDGIGEDGGSERARVVIRTAPKARFRSRRPSPSVRK